MPQAFDQLNNGALTLTTDSSDDLTAVSADAGLADSIGEDVIVGGAANANGGGSSSSSDGLTGPAATGTTSASGSFGGTSCKIGGPAVHVKARANGKGFTARGVASNHGCTGHLTRVRVAFAISLRHHRCRFLGAHHRFGRVTSCQPRQWQKVRGIAHWTDAPAGQAAQGRVLPVGAGDQLPAPHDPEHGPQAHLPAPAALTTRQPRRGRASRRRRPGAQPGQSIRRSGTTGSPPGANDGAQSAYSSPPRRRKASLTRPQVAGVDHRRAALRGPPRGGLGRPRLPT